MDALDLAIRRLAAGTPLSTAEAAAMLEACMLEGVPPVRAAAVLLALRARGETAEEVAGAVEAARRAMIRVPAREPDDLVDTCGTGGGTVTTFNISTAAAFVAAGAGVRVAKHGNRSHTSRSGSSDVLEALGVPLDGTPETLGTRLDTDGLAFLFAPAHHPAMRHLAAVRRELAVPTIMNLVGPLANPAAVRRQVVGVSDVARAPVLAEALRLLGTLHALVVHAEVGMDEVSPVGMTRWWEVRAGSVREGVLDPARLGQAAGDLADLAGASPEQNARRIEAILAGREDGGARAAVVLNAAAAIYVAPGGGDWSAAVDRADAALRSGAARARLEGLRRTPSARTCG